MKTIQTAALLFVLVLFLTFSGACSEAPEPDSSQAEEARGAEIAADDFESGDTSEWSGDSEAAEGETADDEGAAEAEQQD